MTDQGARFSVRLTPRAGRDRIDGVAEGLLRVRVAAPPIDDAANAALVRLLAHELGVPQSAVLITSGRTARRKVIEVAGVDPMAVAERWPGLAV